MNKIEIRNLFLSFGYETKTFFIDECPLYEFINKWLVEKQQLLQSMVPSDDLAICWTTNYDFDGDSKFMRYILNQNNAITPILICPEDLDFSCIVIVITLIFPQVNVVQKIIVYYIVNKAFFWYRYGNHQIQKDTAFMDASL